MEGEEKKIEATSEEERKTPEQTAKGQTAKPKQNTRKRRNNKSAAERKAQKAKANAEKAAAAARKAEIAANGGEDKTAPKTEKSTAEQTEAVQEAENTAVEQTEVTPEKKAHSYRSREDKAEQTEKPAPADAAEKADDKKDDKAEREQDMAESVKSEKKAPTSTKKYRTGKNTPKSTETKTVEAERQEEPAAQDDKPATPVEDKPAEDKPATEPEAKDAEKEPAETASDTDEKADAEQTVEHEAEKPEDVDEAQDPDEPSEDEASEDSDQKPVLAEDESELSEEERRHKAEITRTVQVSIEQILARTMEEDTADEAQSTEEPDTAEATGTASADDTGETSQEDGEENETIAQRIGEAATDGLFRLFKWLLLVAVFAAVIAGLGVYWLYRGTTPDMVPQLALSVDGQTVETAAYEWSVPVVGNLFKRTYAETLHTEPVVLAKDLENASPSFVLDSGEEYDTVLTVKNSAGEEVYNGTLMDFEKFSFTENDNYTALLIITSQDGVFTGDALVTGRQVYQFAFGVDIRPTVRVNTQSITQGGVVSVSVTNIPEGETPSLVSGLSNAGFVKTAKGWIAYIPIPCEADTSKSYNIRVKTASYDQTVTLTVRPRTSAYKDYTYEGALTGNYISVDNTPDKVNQVLDICDPQVYWMASGFVQPFIHSITVTLPYGTTEYVGRTAAQRTSGAGSGRTSTCVVVSGHQGEVLISPADGRVVLAEDLGGDAGKTVVIEHGAGLKSLFYNLDKINVQEGDPVVQGQILGETNKVTVAEVRIGRVPVEPLSIWRGQCDAVKNY